MYDVFISYRRDGGFATARLLYEHLKSVGLTPFFDLEELRSGQFNVKLYDAIDESANFVLVLPPKALDRCTAENDWLRLEIEHAIAKEKNIVPVMLEGFEWSSAVPASLGKLHTYNAVQLSRDYFDASISKLLSMLRGVTLENGKVTRTEYRDERLQNTYFSAEDKKETRRLKVQQNLMKEFDSSTYENVKQSYDELRILDIGSNNGDFIMDRLGKDSKVSKLVGIEYDEPSVNIANLKYGVPQKIQFFSQNVENELFAEYLQSIMDDNGIETFNVINISMVLLHLKSPYKLLKTLRSFLSADGTLIIKDIDDGFNVAYPDEQGNFARVIDICAYDEPAGFRKSGRQIYTLLSRAGFGSINLEKLGMTTVGMDFDQRAALFDTYFSFILEDMKIMRNRYPDDKRIKLDYDWYTNVYEELEEKFLDKNFFFSIGFVLFTARKK